MEHAGPRQWPTRDPRVRQQRRRETTRRRDRGKRDANALLEIEREAQSSPSGADSFTDDGSDGDRDVPF